VIISHYVKLQNFSLQIVLSALNLLIGEFRCLVVGSHRHSTFCENRPVSLEVVRDRENRCRYDLPIKVCVNGYLLSQAHKAT
jgi:hypothetical protein